MEDPTRIEGSGGASKGDENKTEIKGNTTGNTNAGDFVAGTVLAERYRIISQMPDKVTHIVFCKGPYA